MEALKKLDHEVILTENDGPDAFLRDVARATGVGLVPVGTPIYLAAAILACASLFVSGRYHPAIMAMLGGTPCVFLDTTAHKMDSLQELIGVERRATFPAMPGPVDIDAIVECANDHLRAGTQLRQRIRSAAGLRAAEVATLPHRLEDVLVRPQSAARGALESGRGQ